MGILNKILQNRVLNKMMGSIYLGLHKFYQEMKHLEYRKKYEIHPSFKFNGPDILLYGKGKIQLGENSYIGRQGILASLSPTNTITIGKGCSISHYVTMYTQNRIPDQDFSITPHKKESGDIEIGDNCWIGIGAFIKHGIKIGNNCVIAAKSVVTKDVPNNSLVAGNPAKVIKTLREHFTS
jgi:maltose O-acetyltransferase